MSNRLGGRQGTAYTGTNANQPPNWTFSDRDPNQYDIQNVSVGDMWHNSSNEKVWVLVSLAGDMNSKGSLATWIEFGGSSAGVIDTLTGNTGGAVGPTGDNINIVGDNVGITIVGNPGTSTLTASLVGSGSTRSFVTDSGTATPAGGVINIKANTASLNAGSSVSLTGSSNSIVFNVTDANGNTLIGEDCGNLILTGASNTGQGFNCLHALTTGTFNSCFGIASGQSLTSGSDNFFAGSSAGASITTGSDNVFVGTSCSNLAITSANSVIIGTTAGAAYRTSESNNIVVGRNVGLVGDNNTIRIGSDGVTAPNQTQCFINGITGITPSGALSTVKINSNGQLGTGPTTTSSYTPILSFGGASVGITYTAQAGNYNQVGNIVYFSLFVALSSKGSSTGTAAITMPPVTPLGIGLGPTIFTLGFGSITLDAGYTFAWGDMQTPGSMEFHEGGSGLASVALNDTNFSNGSNFKVSGYYFTA